jgi:WS/DGAT/MGAT family acyltransferase
MDLMFLLSETPDAPSHVAGLLVFELPKGAGPKFVRDVVEAYRKACPVAPFNRVPRFPALGRPVWKEADTFDMGYHVQHLALPTPGSDAELHRLVEMLHGLLLDRNQPLFQVFVIEGLAHRRFALYCKVHHACVDGQSAIARLLASFATTRGARRMPPFHAAAAVASRPRLPRAIANRIAASSSMLVDQGLAIRDLSVNVLRKLAGSFTRRGPATLPFTAPRTPANEVIRAGRCFATLSLPIEAMRVVGKRFGGTLNDVAVTVVDAGFARYLEERGKLPSRPLVAMCPMSLRDAGDKEATTKVSALIAPLGGAEQSVARRLERVIANIAAAKDDIRTMSKAAALDYAILLFAIAEGVGRLEAGSITRPPANFVLSNVPGTPDTLYLGGARLTAMFPVSMLIGHIGLNVTLASYAGNMDFGFVGNRSALRDLEPLVRHCGRAFAELQRAAAGRGTPATAGS